MRKRRPLARIVRRSGMTGQATGATRRLAPIADDYCPHIIPGQLTQGSLRAVHQQKQVDCRPALTGVALTPSCSRFQSMFSERHGRGHEDIDLTSPDCDPDT